MMTRPKGVPNKNGYTMSNMALDQRRQNALKINGKSYIIDNAIKDSSLTSDQKEAIQFERKEIWRKLSSPAILLADEYAELKTLINIKRMESGEYLSKDLLSASKVLLDISKEINRLTQVSADKKIDLISKNFNAEDELTFDVDIGEDDE